ncbi:MAG: DUF1049 domain-containing protein [Alkalibacterium sp.]|nr:DUF1049 domain-containing protein [Alkalibacterium sp.]
MKRQWSMIGAIVLFLLVAILSVLNVDRVPINFGFAEVELPLIVIIFASVLLGALIATLLSTFKIYKDQRNQKQQKDSKRKTRSKSSEKEETPIQKNDKLK